jgi:hypothetical protein
MVKKHWIYIKRGLSESAKHRAQMGECIWLFMHIIDRADWETGIAYDWRDKDEAAQMEMPLDTLRYQRKKLEELDYIRCKQKQHGQDISIMEWKNPRDYGSETKNPRVEGSNGLPPSEFQGSNQGLNQGSNQVTRQIKTPTYSSKIKDHKSVGADKPSKANQIPEVSLYREVTGMYPARASFETVVTAVGQVRSWLGRDVAAEDLKPFYVAWCNRGWNKQAVTWLTDYAAANRLPNGLGKNNASTPLPVEETPEQLAARRAEADRLFGVQS